MNHTVGDKILAMFSQAGHETDYVRGELVDCGDFVCGQRIYEVSASESIEGVCEEGEMFYITEGNIYLNYSHMIRLFDEM